MGEIRERGMARVRGREVRAKLRERPASMHRCRGPCVAARALHRTMEFLCRRQMQNVKRALAVSDKGQCMGNRCTSFVHTGQGARARLTGQQRQRQPRWQRATL
jgi:hypothetical protein